MKTKVYMTTKEDVEKMISDFQANGFEVHRSDHAGVAISADGSTAAYWVTKELRGGLLIGRVDESLIEDSGAPKEV